MDNRLPFLFGATRIYRYSFYNIPFFCSVMGMLVLIYSLFYPHMVCAIRGSKVQQQLIIKKDS